MTQINTESAAASSGPANAPARFSKRQVALTVGALGVVYGDIGTSPLYAVRESVMATGGSAASTAAVLGAISLIFWSLILIVTVKYVVFVLRADNRGEGGVLALATMAHRTAGLPRWAKAAISVLGVIGLALFYGDGVLTPAISVLSAVEGLGAQNGAFGALILPITLVILVGLFLLQSRGTARIGSVFGPVIFIWFIVLAGLGLVAIIKTPAILAAVNPYWGAHLFAMEPWAAFVALGSVFLAVTGSEALYADMGHFGRLPIRIGWLAVALPALTLNYFGQGALILSDPSAVETPFYSLAPDYLHYPMVALATMATIIASQAVISGVFSVTRQAVQLGLLPRLEIRHTSATEYGQIYVPRANALMMTAVIAAVFLFRDSGALAAAYGMAVVGIMTITTFLLLVIATRRWQWKMHWLLLGFGVFLLIDLTLLSSIMLKFVDGGWFPLVIAAAVFMVMDTWRKGRRALTEKTYGSGLATDLFLERADKTPLRVAGTAIFITPRLDEVPGALLHNLKHNQVLHERVIFLRVNVEDVPFVPADKRLEIDKLGKGFYTVEVNFGFFQTPDVPRALLGARAHGLAIDIDHTTFFVRHETLVKARKPSMQHWRRAIFMRLYGSALEAARFYNLPPGRVVELGSLTEF